MHSGAPPSGAGCSRWTAMSDRALRTQSPTDDQAYAQTHLKANYGATKPKEASVRAVALSSTGVDPRESECDDLVEELLLRVGYLENLPPSPILSAHGLYRLTDRGMGLTEES
jgi:hypothetical protein